MFVHSWEADIWYKIFNFTTFMFLWSQSLNSWVFCLIFLFWQYLITKTNWRSLHSGFFFKILKEPTLVQKQTVPHMKAPILSFFDPEGQGCGIIMGAPRPPPVKCLLPFLSEVLEAKWGWKNQNWFIMSNVRILWLNRYQL